MTDVAKNEPGRRLVHVGAALAVGLAGVGFLRGVRETDHGAASVSSAPVVHAYAPAPGYADLRTTQRGPNARLYETAVPALSRDLPALGTEVRQTDEERAAALALRATRRAYDGAPPTIPHDVGQRDEPPCLACHENGARIAGKTATRMSHERHDNCLQCHVVMNDPRPGAPRVLPPENGFVGAPSASRGERAYAGAPPTIPHPTLMRTECGSCHGVAGISGMRSTHPWRQSCTQCHAPSATLDQRELGGTVGPAGWSTVP
jgi:cytochrome c-type protein NapB